VEKDFRLYQVAKMYFIEKMKQNTIAQVLGISNIQVSRLIKRAEREGIVSFKVEAPLSINWKLGKQFKSKYPYLKEAVVVNSSALSDARELVGGVAAKYVQSLIEQNTTIGISWGRTLLAFVRALDVCSFEGVKVFQMSGGFLFSENTDLMPSNMVKLAGNKLGAESFIWNAPLFVASREVKQSLMLDPSLQYVNQLGQNMDIAVFGISSLLEHSTMRKTGVISSEDMQELESLGAVGDVMGYFIDRKGSLVMWSKAERSMGIQPSVFSKTNNAICLATGIEKADILKLTIEHKYCNTLIISSDLAHRVLTQ